MHLPPPTKLSETTDFLNKSKSIFSQTFIPNPSGFNKIMQKIYLINTWIFDCQSLFTSKHFDFDRNDCVFHITYCIRNQYNIQIQVIKKKITYLFINNFEIIFNTQ